MMEILVGVGCMMLMAAPIVVLWVIGIDHMKKNHPNYKGEDFLGEE